MLRKRALICVACMLLLFGSIPSIQAVASSTLDKLNQAQQEKKEAEEELENKQEEIGGLKNEQDSLKGELNKLNQELTKVSENLSSLEGKLKEQEQQIEMTQQALEEAKQIEKEQYESMKQRIRFMYERGNTAYLEMILSSQSFSDFLNKTDYINKLSEYDRKMLDEYQATREKITEEEEELQKEKAALEETKAEVQKQQNKVSGLVKNTNSNIQVYGSQIDSAEQLALEIEEEIRKKENDIVELKKKYEEELALSKLAANSVWRDISQVTFAEGDEALLAALIYCEAGGESYEGKVAVGAVAINRVLSSRYPDSLVGVIYQSSQFSPVGSGRLAAVLAEGKATQSCYQAAKEAMSGRSNVGNCLYFRTPIPGVNPRYTIGGHIFY